MKKKIVSLLLTLLLVLSLTACKIVIDGEDAGNASNNTAANGTVGLSVSTQNNPFFVTLVEGAKKAAAEVVEAAPAEEAKAE